MFRTNTYDPATRRSRIDPVRARAFEANLAALLRRVRQRQDGLRHSGGARSRDPDRLRQLAAFFFWTSWAASTNRPDDTITYTNNWPHEPLVGNRPRAKRSSGPA